MLEKNRATALTDFDTRLRAAEAKCAQERETAAEDRKMLISKHERELAERDHFHSAQSYEYNEERLQQAAVISRLKQDIAGRNAAIRQRRDMRDRQQQDLLQAPVEEGNDDNSENGKKRSRSSDGARTP